MKSASQDGYYEEVEQVDEYPEVPGINTARDVMKNLPEKEKEVIDAQVTTFQEEKKQFDIEVAKWEDTDNDIVLLAKHMCMIMMHMTDFTRYV